MCINFCVPHPSPCQHRNTVKFVVGLSPGGAITFVSPGYPGRITDPQIVEVCGLLLLLENQDHVMADKGSSVESFYCFTERN
jgi:hypothetical protein